MGELAVTVLIAAANRIRRAANPAGPGLDARAARAEARLEALFGCCERLAVYGSLAPGRENHHVVAPLGGEWSTGVVEGDLAPSGWGAAMGYPALRLRSGGPAVPVSVLVSPRLPMAWADLDAFEGMEYRRVLVPVWDDGAGGRTLVTVANLYEAAAAP